ncbi:MAG: hypothetical protein KF729_25245 [Sandaracinaceae bacterium]|nr:hypothetical protein [Sandaracinaceae bacterium]
MPRLFRSLCIVLAGGCTGGFGNMGGRSPSEFIESIPPDMLACPIDPDCAIGGDCRLYECPEHWVCEERSDGYERCVSPGPDYPDGGGWSCRDEEGRTICEGGSYPDGGGGNGWSCMQAGDLVTCVKDRPDYPDGGGGSGWSCWFEGDLRVCSTVPGDHPGGGGWTCWDDETGRHCRRPRPDLPDGGNWTCYDYEGVTHCDGGTDIPDGGGWECVERDGRYYCRTTPDYPDGGGGGAWNCRFTREFRVCDAPDGGGGIPRTDCPPTDPSCGRYVCEESRRGSIRFFDDRDGTDDGELVVFGDGRRDQACGRVRVDVTGYYSLFNGALAESCSRQLDEIAYVTITNSCNASGNPLERNVGDRFVVGDVDNTPACTSDAECGAGHSCQSRSAGFCCVPTAPALVGTFLLIAGEDNLVCLNHVCPEVRAGAMRGADAFITAGCEGSINSVHLNLAGATDICPDPAVELPSRCG